jgi:hypothetical protein
MIKCLFDGKVWWTRASWLGGQAAALNNDVRLTLILLGNPTTKLK